MNTGFWAYTITGLKITAKSFMSFWSAYLRMLVQGIGILTVVTVMFGISIYAFRFFLYLLGWDYQCEKQACLPASFGLGLLTFAAGSLLFIIGFVLYCYMTGKKHIEGK